MFTLIAPLGGWVMSRLFATVTGGMGSCSGLLPLLGMGNDQAFCHVTGGWVTVLFRLLSLLGMGNVQAFCHCYRGMDSCSGLLPLLWGDR